MTHVMELIADHEGTEEWLCPICGRRFLIEWNPWHKVVVDDGDINAQHSGGKGGLQIGSIGVRTGDEE